MSCHYFCPQCKFNITLCKSPTTHNCSYIPETFVGAAVRIDHEEEEQASTWGFDSINKGSLGSTTLLTSVITLINGQDTIKVNCLWDSGSESSFFSPAFLPFATDQRKTYFKIETLSPSASKPEVVHGIEAAFQVAIPDGEVIQLNLLQHTGLQTRNMKLKSKLLTCSSAFSKKHDLGFAPCHVKTEACHMSAPARLSIILGMDVMHLGPTLVDKFQDRHGFLALYACKLSNSLIPMGNCQFPYSAAEAQSALSNDTSNLGVSTSSLEEDEVSNDSLPLTSSFHGVTSDYSVAIRLSPKRPTLQFLHCPEEFEPPASPNLAASCTPPVVSDQQVVASTVTACA